MRQRGRGREKKRKIEGDSRREGEENERMGTDDCTLSFGPHRPESREAIQPLHYGERQPYRGPCDQWSPVVVQCVIPALRVGPAPGMVDS